MTESQRVVTLPEILVEELKVLKERQENEKGILGDDYRNYDLVFAIPGGGPIIPRNLVKQFKSLLKKAGISESIRFHDLRHSHASLLLASKIPIKAISARLGHSSTTITQDIFACIATITR